MPKIMVVYGTRPEAIKVAPLIRALESHPALTTQVTSTGQHREMLRPIEAAFGLTPEVTLDSMRPGQDLTSLFSTVATGMDDIIANEKPQAVVVHGDTSTAAAVALAAFHRQVPVVHLEAGLRSGDLASPFPEEGNRKLIGQIATLHLAPTARAKSNLIDAAVTADDVVITGNTVIDALLWAEQIASSRPWPAELSALARRPASTKVVLVTLHRRENLDGSIERVCRELAALARQHPELLVVFPMHLNPRVRRAVQSQLAGLKNVLLTEPFDYLTMVRVLRNASLVVTDSGGIQEEAPTFGVPVLVARDTTERPEAVAAGCAELVGDDEFAIRNRITEMLARPFESTTTTTANPFGDGDASRRAVAAIAELVGVGVRSEEFVPYPPDSSTS